MAPDPLFVNRPIDAPEAAQKFRAIRQTLDMTQQEFAEALGLPPRKGAVQISFYETGRRPISSRLMLSAALLLENSILKQVDLP